MRSAFLLSGLWLLGCATGRDWDKAAVPRGATVAVLAFDADGRPDTADEASVEDALLKLGLKVVDRSTFVALMKEQRLDLSGAIRPEDAHEIGQMSGASYFVVRQQVRADASAAPELDPEQVREYDEFVRRYLDPANLPVEHQGMERSLDSIGRRKAGDPSGSLRLLSVAEGRVLGATNCRSSELGREASRLIFPAD